MNLTKYSLGEYTSLLTTKNLLADPLPAGLDLSRTVELVSYDSKNVVPGTLFLCKGAHFRPEYLQQAADRGAFAYVSETPYPEVDLPCIHVTDMRQVIAPFAVQYYNDPSRLLNVIGITGTKGKSSTTYYLKYILDEYLSSRKVRCGVISSIDTYDGVEEFESHLTTPEPLELQKHFANALSSGLGYLTMEVSSQALKYHRTLGTRFAAACFLNIGTDHISPIEHPDFEDYFQSKLKIFAQAEVSCVNLDCDHADRVEEAARRDCRRVVTFSRTNPKADVYGSHIRKRGNDIIFRVTIAGGQSREFQLTMPGLFNTENALAAIAVCHALGIPQQCIYVGLMKARVPGRMEVYTNANDHITAIVDYAHNRMSFETLFKSVLEEYPGRRIVTVFGCPGKKALDRRRDLGEVSGKYSDLVVLTEEDSGEEDTVSICKEIATHVAEQGCAYEIQPNRGEAIRQAILGCDKPTVILITGKGAETRQKRGLEYIDTPSDVDYSKTFLQEYDVIHGLDGLEKVRSISSVLPALKEMAGQTVVVKYGGSALGPDGAVDSILQDVATLQMAGLRVVLVHGGGKNITALLERLNVPTHFENGYRVTDEAALGVAEMALSAQVNKSIVSALNDLDVAAVGVSGKDGHLITAQCKNPALGRVGQITQVDTRLLETLLGAGFLPVVSPIAGGDGAGYNCNADDAAQAIAEALHAHRLVFLTDVGGILIDSHNTKTAVAHMDAQRARELMDAGLIAGGMVPKVQGCLHALESGVGEVSILDGHCEHVLLLDVLHQRVSGTILTP